MERVRTRSIEWLLALLILRHGRAVDRSWLASTLWPDTEESKALQNIRNALVHLRKALGPEKERIQSPTRDTLTFDLKGAEVDVLHFDRAIPNGEPEAIRRAVEGYRGPLLEGCLEEWVFPERTVREQFCLQALEILAEAAEQRQDYTEALGFLHRARQMDALRDTTRRALMRVLVASGDTPAAVNAYRDYRLVLREQMNVEPDAETVQLYQQIRQQARQTVEQRTATPDASPSVPASLTTTLPYPLTTLIGRERETQEITDAISKSRLVTLVGGGGVGKTRLSIQVAQQLAAGGAPEVAFVELAALAVPSLLPGAIATTLGIHEQTSSDSTTTALTDLLGTRSVLLVLDNCEHLIDAAASLTQTLLARCPNLRLLTTSRQRLGLTGEVVWRVPSLPVPEVAQLPSDPTEAVFFALNFPAIQLFVERAVSAEGAFQLTRRAEVEAVCQICRQLDGIPLAIELAASRVRSLSVEAIYGKLDQRFRLLTGGSRAALPRQQTLRSLIDWSYDLLTDTEKALLCRVSVFSGGWTLDAAETICTGGRVEDWETLHLLTSLIDKSLVVANSQSTNMRFHLLETVRQYAADRLRESGEETLWQDRHLDYYLVMAQEADPQLRGPQQQLWLERLETEHDNLRIASKGNGKREMQLANALCRFWMMRGYITEGRGRFADLLTHHASESISPVLAFAFHNAGNLAFMQSDYAAARGYYERAVTMRNQLGDRLGEAATLVNLGSVYQDEGDFPFARAQFERALPIQKELGDKRAICISVTCLGNVLREMEELEASLEYFQEAIRLNRELGNRAGEAHTLNLLGNAYYEIGESGTGKEDWYVASRKAFQQALVINRELGIKVEIANNLMNIARLSKRIGSLKEAVFYYAEALPLQVATGDRRNFANTFDHWAEIELWQGFPICATHMMGVTDRFLEGFASRREGDKKYAERLVTELQEALGETEFAKEFEHGRSMAVEQAVEMVMQSRRE